MKEYKSDDNSSNVDLVIETSRGVFGYGGGCSVFRGGGGDVSYISMDGSMENIVAMETIGLRAVMTVNLTNRTHMEKLEDVLQAEKDWQDHLRENILPNNT